MARSSSNEVDARLYRLELRYSVYGSASCELCIWRYSRSLSYRYDEGSEEEAHLRVAFGRWLRRETSSSTYTPTGVLLFNLVSPRLVTKIQPPIF